MLPYCIYFVIIFLCCSSTDGRSGDHIRKGSICIHRRHLYSILINTLQLKKPCPYWLSKIDVLDYVACLSASACQQGHYDSAKRKTYSNSQLQFHLHGPCVNVSHVSHEACQLSLKQIAPDCGKREEWEKFTDEKSAYHPYFVLLEANVGFICIR